MSKELDWKLEFDDIWTELHMETRFTESGRIEKFIESLLTAKEDALRKGIEGMNTHEDGTPINHVPIKDVLALLDKDTV